MLGLDTAGGGDELRAVLRTYAGLVQLASGEWLHRRSLTRAQVHALLSTALVALIRDVVPAVVAAGAADRQNQPPRRLSNRAGRRRLSSAS